MSQTKDIGMAVLILRVQSELHVLPHKARAVATQIMNESPQFDPQHGSISQFEHLVPADFKAHVSTPADSPARSRRKPSPLKKGRDASPSRKSVPLASPMSASASARDGFGSTAAATMSSPKVDPLSSPLLQTTSVIERVPAVLRRSPNKHDIWAELARLEAQDADLSRQVRHHEAQQTADEYRSQLGTQVQNRREERERQRQETEEEARQLDVQRAAEEAERQRKLQAKASQQQRTFEEGKVYNKAVADARRAERERQLAEEREALAAAKALARREQEEIKEKKLRTQAEFDEIMRLNAIALKEKEAQRQREIEYENKLMAEYEHSMAQKEKEREANVAARQAEIERKLNSMAQAFADADAANREAEEKAQRQREEFDRLADERARAAEAARREFLMSKSQHLDEQVKAHRAELARLRQNTIDARHEVDAEIQAYMQDEAERRRRLSESMRSHRADLERQILHDVSTKMSKDETDMDLKLHGSMINLLKQRQDQANRTLASTRQRAAAVTNHSATRSPKPVSREATGDLGNTCKDAWGITLQR